MKPSSRGDFHGKHRACLNRRRQLGTQDGLDGMWRRERIVGGNVSEQLEIPHPDEPQVQTGEARLLPRLSAGCLGRSFARLGPASGWAPTSSDHVAEQHLVTGHDENVTAGHGDRAGLADRGRESVRFGRPRHVVKHRSVHQPRLSRRLAKGTSSRTSSSSDRPPTRDIETRPSLLAVSNDAFLLRHGVEGDADQLVAVFLRARETAMPWLTRPHDEVANRWWLEYVVLAKLHVRVAYTKTSFLGFAAVNGDWLEHLYVDPDHQGYGVGRRLLEDVQHTSTGHLALYVFKRNERAGRFYQAAGFVLIDESDGSGNEEQEPDCTYTWTAPRGRGDR